MSADLRKRIFIVLGVIAVSLGCLFPIHKRINLGLDLKGGMHLVLKVDNDNLADESAKNDAVLRSIEVLRNRLDKNGVRETLLQRQGTNQILVQLPGVTDRKEALEMVGRVAHLEFRLVNGDAEQFKSAMAGDVPEGYELMTQK